MELLKTIFNYFGKIELVQIIVSFAAIIFSGCFYCTAGMIGEMCQRVNKGEQDDEIYWEVRKKVESAGWWLFRIGVIMFLFGSAILIILFIASTIDI